MNNAQTKTDTTAGNRAEIKELIKSGKAFSFIGETIQKAYQAEDGNFYVECIGSSDQEDLVGDIMSAKALATMEREFVGKTVFMNHRTMVPDDVFGSIVEAKLEKQNGVQLLWFKMVVENENEAAMKTWRMINGGRVQLGTSVTVLVTASKPNPRRKGGIIIDDVEPIEHSIVGVPCNRESKTLAASASKALEIALASKDFSPETDGSEEPENLIEKGEPEMKIDETNAAASEAAEEVTETATEETPAADETKAASLPRTLAAIAVFNSVRDAIAAKAVNLPEIPQLAVKGMFNDILAQEPTLWELYDILCEVKWTLMSEKWRLEYLGQTDFSGILAQWEEALDEFKIAAVSSLKYWGDFDTDAPETVSNAADVEALEKTFRNLAEAYEKTSGEDARGQLRETGKSLLEIAKSLGVEFESAATADTQTEPTPEQIEKSAPFVEMKTELETARKNLNELTEEHEIAKAALAAANEALENYLRQPLVAGKQN